MGARSSPGIGELQRVETKRLHSGLCNSSLPTFQGELLLGHDEASNIHLQSDANRCNPPHLDWFSGGSREPWHAGFRRDFRGRSFGDSMRSPLDFRLVMMGRMSLFSLAFLSIAVLSQTAARPSAEAVQATFAVDGTPASKSYDAFISHCAAHQSTSIT